VALANVAVVRDEDSLRERQMGGYSRDIRSSEGSTALLRTATRGAALTLKSEREKYLRTITAADAIHSKLIQNTR